MLQFNQVDWGFPDRRYGFWGFPEAFRFYGVSFACRGTIFNPYPS